MDVSARRLWSEVAPWPSAIQRLGRLNRDGRLNGDARAYFWEGPEKPKRGARFIGPYEADAVKRGHELVAALVAVYESGDTLPAKEALARLGTRDETRDMVEKALAPARESCPRAIDVHGLFSTEPDVFGGFTDISPFIRSQDENADVTVFWRAWRSGGELRRVGGVDRAGICSGRRVRRDRQQITGFLGEQEGLDLGRQERSVGVGSRSGYPSRHVGDAAAQ